MNRLSDLSLRVRLTLVFVGLLALLLVAFSAVYYFETRSFLISSTATRMRAQAKPVLDAWQAERAGAATAVDLVTGADVLSRQLTSVDTAASLFDATGTFLAHGVRLSAEPVPADPDGGRLAAALAGDNGVTYLASAGGEEVLVALIPVRPAPLDPEVIGVVQLNTPLARSVDPVLRNQLVLFGAAVPLTLAVGALAALFLIGRGLAPLRRLVAVCRRIAGGDLSQRTSLEGLGGEVGQLGVAFDDMVDRLEATFRAQRRFIADAAHELRTPLTALEGSLEVLSRGSQDDPAAARRLVWAMTTDVRRLTRLAEQLLDLTRLEAGSVLYRRRVEVGPLLQAVVDEAPSLTRDRSLGLAAGPDIAIDADPDALRQALFNLIDNAALHTAAGGTILLGWSSGGGGVEISVRDDGEGIAPNDLPHVFEPFYRGDRSRSRRRGGTGLGLTLSRELIEAHGGQLRLDSTPGAGTTVTIVLPDGPSGGR
jgi:signal transduction histidine kinase